MTLSILLIQANVFIPGAIFDGNPYVLKEEVIIIAKGYLKLAWTSPKFPRDSCRSGTDHWKSYGGGGGAGNFRAVVSNGPSLTSRVICLYTDAAKPKLAISVESELLSSAIPKSQDHFDHQRLLWPDFST